MRADAVMTRRPRGAAPPIVRMSRYERSAAYNVVASFCAVSSVFLVVVDVVRGDESCSGACPGWPVRNDAHESIVEFLADAARVQGLLDSITTSSSTTAMSSWSRSVEGAARRIGDQVQGGRRSGTNQGRGGRAYWTSGSSSTSTPWQAAWTAASRRTSCCRPLGSFAPGC
jgi:hypothetical protein